MNDYMGMLLHQAKVQDLVKEAQRGQTIRAARSAPSDRSARLTGRRIASRLVWASFLVTIAALWVAQG
jgi:uncharacterized PurR-regulated membrane protein YhhQ (DUF165 family)